MNCAGLLTPVAAAFMVMVPGVPGSVYIWLTNPVLELSPGLGPLNTPPAPQTLKVTLFPETGLPYWSLTTTLSATGN